MINKIIKANVNEHECQKDYIIKSYSNSDSDILLLENDILEKFENKNQVILVGQVQSGKTKKIINIINKAIRAFKYDLILYFSGITNDLNNQSYDRLSYEVGNVVTTKELHKTKIVKGMVVVSLKQIDNLKVIEDFILSNQDKFKKILIIDDESDYGSINNKKTNEEPSVIYELIYKNIYDLCKDSGGVLKLTATPFANILSKKELYKTSDPYIFSLPTNDNYTGVTFFNKLDSNFWLEIESKNTNNIDRIAEYKNDIIDSFFLWIYKSYLLYLDDSIKNKKSEFLINISMNNEDHNEISKIISYYAYDNLAEFKSTLKFVLIKKVDKGINNNLIDDIAFFYNNVIKKSLRIIIFNQKNCKSEINKDYVVYIGGVLLSRGKTFENLIYELITIENQFNYDSLLQKCRWFGYRSKRSKYMALMCNEEIKKQLYVAQKIIDIFHKDNLGYELNYEMVLKKLKNLENQFLNNVNLTTTRKI